MPALKIAIELTSLRLPFRKAVATAAELGADGVVIDARSQIQPQELTDTAVRELRNLLSDVNLRVAAVAFRTRRGYGATDDLERRVAATMAAMKMAASLGAPIVMNQIGRVPSESQGTTWDTLVQSLSDLSHYGHRIGARLAAQTGTESGADLARLLAALPAGGIVVDLDPAELIMNGFAPLDVVAAVGREIVHVQARDAARDIARGRALEVPVGRGSVDFPALFGAMEEFAFRGYWTISREGTDQPIAEIAAALEYLRSL